MFKVILKIYIWSKNIIYVVLIQKIYNLFQKEVQQNAYKQFEHLYF